jgi:hypothetical protein
MFVLLPSVIAFRVFSWSDRDTDKLPPTLTSILLGVPLLIAIVFGTYSVVFVNSGWRNILGVIGLTAAIVIVLTLVLYGVFCVS